MSTRKRLIELEREVNGLNFVIDLLVKQVSSLENRITKMESDQLDSRDHLNDVMWNEKETSRAVKLILDRLELDVECVEEHFKLVHRKGDK